jgi:molybdopterin converting factor small subunit
MCRVVLPGALRQYGAPATPLDIPVGDAATLGQVLDVLDEHAPGIARRIRDERGQLRRFVNIYIDGADARQVGGLDATVPAAAEVLVLPSVAGG